MSARHLPSTITMQCFEAAARHMSFTRAADELCITQSAVSKQVAQLEAYLAHKLFRRVRRSLVLTPEGSQYLTEVRRILAQIEMSANSIMTYRGQAERLRVACLPTFGARWLSRQLPAFLEAHPRIDLSIHDHVEAFDLEHENIEVAIFHGHGHWPNLECHKLFDEAVVAVGAPDYLARQTIRAAHDLAECRLLHLSTRPDAWHRWFADQHISSEHSYHGTRVETFQMLIATVLNGGGLALVPRFFVDEELAAGHLALAWPHVLRGPDAYYLVHPEHLGELPRVRHFVEHLLTRAAADTPIN
ncbi:LysR substrate-binding domain-containing protein [Halomonas sp. 18H]|nr:LysR substrate-binding domain-containing protein [Halomonas sp. 18H]MCW4153026.1 LysR substrate-binding domain-containing protein [Halomonas sp. 18H]